MRHKLVVGPVAVSTDVELTPRQLRDLLRFVASIALALPAEDLEEARAPVTIGFVTDRAEEHVDTRFDWLFEEERDA